MAVCLWEAVMGEWKGVLVKMPFSPVGLWGWLFLEIQLWVPTPRISTDPRGGTGTVFSW